jgi:hypothetical protein
MMYKKANYGCINDPKLWSHRIRNWGGGVEGGKDCELSHAAVI